MILIVIVILVVIVICDLDDRDTDRDRELIVGQSDDQPSKKFGKAPQKSSCVSFWEGWLSNNHDNEDSDDF